MSDSARIDWTCVDSALAIVNDLAERLILAQDCFGGEVVVYGCTGERTITAIVLRRRAVCSM